MKARGFTLLELVIVLVLIGISAAFGTRFIADLAGSYVGTAQRAQALAGARFAMERIKRELSLAYSPSLYLSESNRCVSFVPVLAAGKYSGLVSDGSARFIVPLVLQGEPVSEINLAVRADSSAEEVRWKAYPASLPDNVVALKDLVSAPDSLAFADAFGLPASFDREGQNKRYTLLHQRQLRFCLQNGGLWRDQKTAAGWSAPVLMLTNIMSSSAFSDYDESLQLLHLELSLQTRDGELVLPSQISVIYEP
ncbi:prepilin-type N-terminal cleavage/methylation domain-containing protein [Zobellella aerophila]|uniref:MSHA biogenesis protein MshO n=1 Tax=Zobellella aerophila TaxID=870480 RepID=A0ABP6VBM1_9GAMM